MSLEQTVEQTVNADPADLRIIDPAPIIRRHAAVAAATGFVPIPALDFAVLTGVQIKLLHALAKAYGVPFDHEVGKSVVRSLLGSLGTIAAGSVAASAVKLLPGVGTLLGGASCAAVAAAVTNAMGRVAVTSFAHGRGLDDLFSAEAATQFAAALRDVVTCKKPQET